jgi:hypothetical protein
LREEGSLDYDVGFVLLQIQMNFDTTINRQQAPFFGTVAGEQAIKIRSSIAFLNYFNFSFDFLLHLLVLIILKMRKKSI